VKVGVVGVTAGAGLEDDLPPSDSLAFKMRVGGGCGSAAEVEAEVVDVLGLGANLRASELEVLTVPAPRSLSGGLARIMGVFPGIAIFG